jgi:hypothetical protein
MYLVSHVAFAFTGQGWFGWLINPAAINHPFFFLCQLIYLPASFLSILQRPDTHLIRAVASVLFCNAPGPARPKGHNSV